MTDEEEDYFIPLEDQRVFGAGIKKKGITFVPATTETGLLATSQPSRSAGDKYLAIVLGDKDSGKSRDGLSVVTNEPRDASQYNVCSICNQPLIDGNDKLAVDSHESSIAHQVCLEHSHPPSHLDRDHVGLKYLSGYGWNPDSRKGLGINQEGIRIPIKAKEKHNTSGLGLGAPDEDEAYVRPRKPKPKDKKIIKLNAKETRKIEQDKSKRAERLREQLYGEDLSHYLGPNG